MTHKIVKTFSGPRMNKPIRIRQQVNSLSGLLATFIISLSVVFLMMDRSINVYDEGVILTAAMRVAAGDVIHRDFYANYGPAEFYLVSWLFKLFGQNVIAERALDLIVRAGISTAIYSSLVFYSRRWVALVVTSVCVVWLSTVGNHGYPIYPALLLTIGSTLMMARALAGNVTIWHPFHAGLLTGSAALFRYDIGFLAFVAHIVSAIIIIELSRREFGPVLQGVQNRLLVYVIGAALPVIAILFWYLRIGAFNSFLHDVVVFPGQYYASTRGLPFPGTSSFFDGFGLVLFAIYMPIVVIVAVVIGFLGKQTTGFVNLEKASELQAGSTEKHILVVLLAILVPMFYLKGMVRVSLEHMQLALLPSIMLLALLYEISVKHKVWFKGSLAVMALLFIVTAWISCQVKFMRRNLVLDEFAGSIEDFSVTSRGILHVAGTDRNSTSLFPIDSYRAAAIRFVVQNTAPEERIFVGLTRHDKVFINDVSAYFLTNRLPATKWHHFDPGLQTSARIQSHIVFELNETKPSYIWLESTWNGVNEPNDSAISSGVIILDEYISRNYEPVRSFGSICILRRSQG